MQLNQYGVIAKQEWIESSVIRKEIELDEYVLCTIIFMALSS